MEGVALAVAVIEGVKVEVGVPVAVGVWEAVEVGVAVGVGVAVMQAWVTAMVLLVTEPPPGQEAVPKSLRTWQESAGS